MNYKKIKKDNYTLHFINTDRFKEINVVIKFTKPYVKEEAPYYKLLERVLITNGTNKYSRKEISRECENLYNALIATTFFVMSKNMVFEIKASFINPKYTSMDMYQKTFDLFKEIILNPKIKDGLWNQEVFDIEKENLIDSIMNIKDDPETYAKIKFEEKFYKGTPYGDNNYKNIELFKNLDNAKLYLLYKALFDSFKIDVFVLGDVIEEEISSLVDNLIKDFKENNKLEKDLYIKLKLNKERISKDEIKMSQSNLFLGLTINGLTDYERNYVLVLYNAILGSMNNSVLFVNVREKHSLCYYIGSMINRFTDSLVINSGISAHNYEKSLELIRESLKSMEDEKVVSKLIINAKKTLEISYNDFYDNIGKIINYYYINEVSYLPSIEERREAVNNVSVSEICALAKKIEIKEIYLLEGSLE